MATKRKRTSRLPKVDIPDYMRDFFGTGKTCILLYMKFPGEKNYREVWDAIGEDFTKGWVAAHGTQPYMSCIKSENRNRCKSRHMHRTDQRDT